MNKVTNNDVSPTGEAYTCSKCGKTFKPNSDKQGVSCLVLHLEGSCCHYSETEVKPSNSPLSTESIDDWLWNFILEVGAEYAKGLPRHASRYDEAKAKINDLIKQSQLEARIDELNQLTTNMIDSKRSNADWYREPFECVHNLAEERIEALSKLKEEYGKQ